MLAEKLHGGNVNDKEVSERVRGSVAASPGLRDKADLIEAFLKTVGFADEPDTAEAPLEERHEVVQRRWRAFIAAFMEKEISQGVTEQNLKPGEMRKVISEAFDKGGVPDQGTAVGKILKPASRFAKGNSYGERRRAALDSLWAFYGRYRSLTNSYPPATEFGTSGGETGDDIS